MEQPELAMRNQSRTDGTIRPCQKPRPWRPEDTIGFTFFCIALLFASSTPNQQSRRWQVLWQRLF